MTLVALRKESVDRNINAFQACFNRSPSLSARRAWIEICRFSAAPGRHKSLSARRAWIEIPQTRLCIAAIAVALRKESVDRNSTDIPLAFES